MKYLIILFILVFNLNAKIIEVEQLFNKSIIKVKEENIKIKKSYYGKTKIDESKIVDINTYYDGFIKKLYANKTLMYINKEKPLFTIYSEDIVSIQEELLLGKKSKNKNIYKSSLNKLNSFDINEKTLNKIKKSSSIINDIEVYSPINGYLIKKNINNKSFIKKGKLILQVADYSQLWVIAKVYQKDLNFINKDMKVDITIDGSKNVIPGKIDFIYPKIDDKKQILDVRIVIDNKKLNIYPNMFAKINVYKNGKTMLTLPRTAVLTKGDKHYIFKPLNDKEFEPVLVTAKRIDSEKYEIIEGLNKGDKVIDKVLFMLDSDSITNGLYDTDIDEDW